MYTCIRFVELEYTEHTQFYYGYTYTLRFVTHMLDFTFFSLGTWDLMRTIKLETYNHEWGENKRRRKWWATWEKQEQQKFNWKPRRKWGNLFINILFIHTYTHIESFRKFKHFNIRYTSWDIFTHEIYIYNCVCVCMDSARARMRCSYTHTNLVLIENN